MFLGATKHLYNWLCPSVGWSVGLWGNAFVRRSTRRTLLAYLALFPYSMLQCNFSILFADTRLYKLLCWSVGRSVGLSVRCFFSSVVPLSRYTAPALLSALFSFCKSSSKILLHLDFRVPIKQVKSIFLVGMFVLCTL